MLSHTAQKLPALSDTVLDTRMSRYACCCTPTMTLERSEQNENLSMRLALACWAWTEPGRSCRNAQVLEANKLPNLEAVTFPGSRWTEQTYSTCTDHTWCLVCCHATLLQL